ncbi:hypothetical protein IFR05_003799 [Cadophora sp. M221]|nr:hypothetical protein IFR05_003799 [Cadophora sp. M221]
MELLHLPRAVLLVSLAFNFQVLLAADANLTTEIGTLPICAQACIASSFSTCSCRMLDFDCACACTTFSPTASFCVQGACSPSYLKPAVEMMSLACPPALPSTSTSSSSRTQTTVSATISGGTFRTASADPAPSPTVTTPAGPYSGGISGNSSYPGGSSECLYQTASGVPGQPTCWFRPQGQVFPSIAGIHSLFKHHGEQLRLYSSSILDCSIIYVTWCNSYVVGAFSEKCSDSGQTARAARRPRPKHSAATFLDNGSTASRLPSPVHDDWVRSASELPIYTDDWTPQPREFTTREWKLFNDFRSPYILERLKALRYAIQTFVINVSWSPTACPLPRLDFESVLDNHSYPHTAHDLVQLNCIMVRLADPNSRESV